MLNLARVVLVAGGLGCLLPACVVQVVQAPAGAGGDTCQAQSVAFTDLARGLPPGGAIAPGRWQDGGPPVQPSLAPQLAAENALLERLQIAFDALLYCRWIELRTIRADFAGARIDRATAQQRLAAGRTRLGTELDGARAAAARVQDRGRGLQRSVERAAPGAVPAAPDRGAPLTAVAAATVPLRLRPDPAAPEVGRVAAGSSVTLRPAAAGFALIEPPGGIAGYAPAGAFNLQARGQAAPVEPRLAGGELRTLLATNLARRENFQESVEISGRSLSAGFEEAI